MQQLRSEVAATTEVVRDDELQSLIEALHLKSVPGEASTVADVAESLGMDAAKVAEALREVRLQKQVPVIPRRRRERTIVLGVAVAVVAWWFGLTYEFWPNSDSNPPLSVETVDSNLSLKNGPFRYVHVGMRYHPSSVWRWITGPRFDGPWGTTCFVQKNGHREDHVFMVGRSSGMPRASFGRTTPTMCYLQYEFVPSDVKRIEQDYRIDGTEVIIGIPLDP